MNGAKARAATRHVSHAGTTDIKKLIPLRILAPVALTHGTLELLGNLQSVINVVVLRGAGHKPEGDLILCHVAADWASDVVADLRNLGVDRDGSIAIGPPETELSMLFPEPKEPGYSSDAIVWAEVEERTSESAELSGTYLLFMTIAVLIAMVGIYTNSSILIIGAMIVGPDFGPIAGVCVATVNRQFAQAGKSLWALISGYGIGIIAAYLLTLVLEAARLIPKYLDPIDSSLEISITQPGFFPVLVALLAGAAGMLSLTTSRSGPLIGVLVSVTTIPAAANIAVTLTHPYQETLMGTVLQLVTNVGAMLLAGIITLTIQLALQRRRRALHLRELARQEERPNRS